jgi:hypothetical protein
LVLALLRNGFHYGGFVDFLLMLSDGQAAGCERNAKAQRGRGL